MKVKGGGALESIAYFAALVLVLVVIYGMGGTLEGVLGLKGVE